MSASAWKLQAATDFRAWHRGRGLTVAKLCLLIYGEDSRTQADHLRRISKGESISDVTEEYAWLYCITDLASVDPRTVPPKEFGPAIIANSQPRAMSDEDLQHFREVNGERIAAIRAEIEEHFPVLQTKALAETPAPTVAPTPPDRSLLGLTLDQLINSVSYPDAQAVADQVTARILSDLAFLAATKEMSQSTDTTRVVLQVSESLYDLLFPFVSSRHKSISDRDKLKEAVWLIFEKLVAQLDILTRDQADREQYFNTLLQKQESVESIPFSEMKLGDLMRRFQGPSTDEITEAITSRLWPQLNPLIAQLLLRQPSEPFGHIADKASILTLLLQPYMTVSAVKERRVLSQRAAKNLGRLQNIVSVLFILDAAQREERIKTSEDF